MSSFDNNNEMEYLVGSQEAAFIAQFAGPDEDGFVSGATQTLSVNLENDETFDEAVPKFLLKLRKLLNYAGVSKEVIDDLLDKDRLQRHLPHTIVEETFLSAQEGETIEDKPIHEYLQNSSIEHVSVTRKGISDFEFLFTKDGETLTLPKSFFEQVLDAQKGAIDVSAPEAGSEIEETDSDIEPDEGSFEG